MLVIVRGEFETALAALAAQVIERQVLGGLVEKRPQVLDMPPRQRLGDPQIGFLGEVFGKIGAADHLGQHAHQDWSLIDE